MLSYKEYMRCYMQRRFQENRREALKILGGRCKKCGATDDEKHLQLDHCDRHSKKFQTSRIFYLGRERFLAELKKCQLLCAECHEGKTLLDLGRISAKNRHGTLSTYRYCKCFECREAKAAWRRTYVRTDR